MVKIDETYQQIHAEADRLNRLADDLQELSRVEARAYQLDIQPLDISVLVRAVTKRLTPNPSTSLLTSSWLQTFLAFSLTKTAPYKS